MTWVEWTLPILDILALAISILSLVMSFHIFKHTVRSADNTKRLHDILTNGQAVVKVNRNGS